MKRIKFYLEPDSEKNISNLVCFENLVRNCQNISFVSDALLPHAVVCDASLVVEPSLGELQPLQSRVTNHDASLELLALVLGAEHSDEEEPESPVHHPLEVTVE